MKNIIFFDGVCNMCNGWVNWLIDRDKKNIFVFSPLQGEMAKQKLSQLNLKPNELKSIVYLKEDNYYVQSDAILEILKDLGGFFVSLYYIKYLLPRQLRDGVYQWIAKNRYKWFGKSDSCRIPTKALMAKFID